MGKEFQKSALPTLLHFVWVRAALWLHVKYPLKQKCNNSLESSNRYPFVWGLEDDRGTEFLELPGLPEKCCLTT